MVSVNDCTLMTWRAGTGVVLDKLAISEAACSAITNGSNTKILVATSKKLVLIVAHVHGNDLAITKRCSSYRDATIRSMIPSNEIFVAVGRGRTTIWNYLGGQRLHTFENEYWKCVAMSAHLMVMSGCDCKIYVHKTAGIYNLLKTIDLRAIVNPPEEVAASIGNPIPNSLDKAPNEMNLEREQNTVGPSSLAKDNMKQKVE